ncbi:MAG: hypothetical protein Fur0025_37160 [Oscillatoriaceae cyanobacterium]
MEDNLIDELIQILETSTDKDTRRKAAYRLGGIAWGDERAISALVRVLETTTDNYTRQLAAYRLGGIAWGDEKAISELVRVLETSTDEDTRQLAAYRLGGIAWGDEKAISELVRVLETSTDEDTRRQAAKSLGEIDPGNEKAISELVRVLETTTDKSTRRQAAKSLGEIAKGDERAISALVRILETSTNEGTRWEAAYSLGKIDPGNERAISELVRILETSTWYINREVLEWLGEFAKGDERAISVLVRILETSTDEDTRREAAYSLGKIDPGNERAIWALFKILGTSTYEYSRQRAAESLGEIAQWDERAIDLVRILETTTDEDTRQRAVRNLGKIAQGYKRAIRGGNSSSEILNASTQIAYSAATTPVIERVLLMLVDLVTDMKTAFQKQEVEKNTAYRAATTPVIERVLLMLLNLTTDIKTAFQKQEVEENEDNRQWHIARRRNKNIANEYYFPGTSYENGKFYYKQILACLDRMQQERDIIIINRQSLMQSYLQLDQQIVAFSLKFKEYKNTFIYTELFRNRYLVERIAQQDAPLPETISPALAQQVQTAKQTERQTLQAYTDAISNHRPEDHRPETELELLSQAWEEAKQALEALYHQVAETEPEFIAKTKVYPISYEEVQQLLPTDTAIIEFFFTETELITLLILPGADSPRIPETLRVALKPNHLEPLAREWVKDLDDKEKSETNVTDATIIQQLSHRIDRLGEMLNLTHLNQYLPPQIHHLIIVPSNYLHLFPIHALPWNESQRLIDRFSVRYFPNLHIWKICQKRQRSRDSFLGIPNPTQDQGLIFGEAEIASIAQNFAPDQRKVLPSSDATKSKIIAAAQDHHCFHFSGHGEYNFTNPLESYLELSKKHGENLTLSDIFTDLHLPQTNLATLSACCTGVVDVFQRTDEYLVQPTDEYLGLPTGFLLAGAKAVVSSLWKVNSISTAFLLDEFYRQLAQNPDKAVALQKAQNWLRTRNADDLGQRAKEWDLSMLEWRERISLDTTMLSLEGIPFENPYFWAAFIVTGF